MDSLSFVWEGPGEPISEVISYSMPKGIPPKSSLRTMALSPQKIPPAPSKNSGEPAMNLQTLLETGNDLRLLRRPMFGLNGVEEMTPNSQASLAARPAKVCV